MNPKISVIVTVYKVENYLKRCIFCLIAGMTIYIMRGTLLAACAFVLGIMLGIFLICFVCKVK